MNYVEYVGIAEYSGEIRIVKIKYEWIIQHLHMFLTRIFSYGIAL